MTEKRSSEIFDMNWYGEIFFLVGGHPKTSLVPGIQDPLNATSPTPRISLAQAPAPKHSCDQTSRFDAKLYYITFHSSASQFLCLVWDVLYRHRVRSENFLCFKNFLVLHCIFVQF